MLLSWRDFSTYFRLLKGFIASSKSATFLVVFNNSVSPLQYSAVIIKSNNPKNASNAYMGFSTSPQNPLSDV